MKPATIQVQVADMHAFQEWLEKVKDFISEYAWHTRDCAAIDADGEWHKGNSACTCGYDENLEKVSEGIVPK